MRHFLAIAVSSALVAGCANFPELERAVSADARRMTYPNLIPSEDLSAESRSAQMGPETGENLSGRAERLRARADILRSVEIIDDETRMRISDRLENLGG